MEVFLAVIIVTVLLGTFPLHMKFWEDIVENKKLDSDVVVACICFSLSIFPLIGIYQGIKELFNMIELSRKITEDAKQYEIRSGLETNVERKVLDLFNDLFTLNMIHNGGTVFGDNRKKKNIKLEKALRKYLSLKE